MTFWFISILYKIVIIFQTKYKLKCIHSLLVLTIQNDSKRSETNASANDPHFGLSFGNLLRTNAKQLHKYKIKYKFRNWRNKWKFPQHFSLFFSKYKHAVYGHKSTPRQKGNHCDWANHKCICICMYSIVSVYSDCGTRT